MTEQQISEAQRIEVLLRKLGRTTGDDLPGELADQLALWAYGPKVKR